MLSISNIQHLQYKLLSQLEFKLFVHAAYDGVVASITVDVFGTNC